MTWYPAAKFSIAAHVRESSQPAVPRWAKPSALPANETPGGRRTADVHGGQTDEHTAAGLSTPWWRNTRTGTCLSGARRRLLLDQARRSRARCRRAVWGLSEAVASCADREP